MKHKILNSITLLILVLCSYCTAQTSDFIVTNSLDTIYVDKVSTTDHQVKTVINGKKNKYNIDEIISYYISKENKHYERVKNPQADKLKAKQIDRYDYRALETAHIDDYEKRIEYKFFNRLTVGRVKLFTDGLIYNTLSSSGNPPVPLSLSHNDKSYYISIYDSKLELIDYEKESKLSYDINGNFQHYYDDNGLKMTKNVYELLKIYLNGNDEIENKLEKLFLSKPKANEEQIIDLINEYNSWVEIKK